MGLVFRYSPRRFIRIKALSCFVQRLPSDDCVKWCLWLLLLHFTALEGSRIEVTRLTKQEITNLMRSGFKALSLPLVLSGSADGDTDV